MVRSSPGPSASIFGLSTVPLGSAPRPLLRDSTGCVIVTCPGLRIVTESRASTESPNHPRQDPRCVSAARTTSTSEGGAEAAEGAGSAYCAATIPTGAVSLVDAPPLLVAQTTHGHGTGGKRTTT